MHYTSCCNYVNVPNVGLIRAIYFILFYSVFLVSITISYEICPCVLLALDLILSFLKCAQNSGSAFHTPPRLYACALSLTPGCNVALVAAQVTVADAHVSAGVGIAHLPTAPSALAQSGEGRHDVS